MSLRGLQLDYQWAPIFDWKVFPRPRGSRGAVTANQSLIPRIINMKQEIPKPIPGLVKVATQTVGGAMRYQTEIGLTHNTADKIENDIDAVQSAVYAYATGRNALTAAYEMVAEKTEAAKTIATITREILKLKLGKQHSDRWIQTGFTASLAIPRSAGELSVLIFFLSEYLAINPGLEVPALDVTAAGLLALHHELKSAISSVNTNVCAVEVLLATRNQKVAKLRKRVRDLVAELNQLIEPTDTRWHAFGLNIPGYEEPPDTPENIEVIVVNETNAMLKFDRPARANYYRVYKRVVGVDAEPVYIGSPSDTDFTAEDLPRGATIEFIICAVNSGGESALSPPITVVT